MPVLAFALACSAGPDVTLRHIEPPGDWGERLQSARQAKDDYFRTAADTPLRAEDVPDFDGLDYWDPDPGYYLVGSVMGYAEPERRTMLTTAGSERPGEKVGWIRFVLGGRVQTLQVFRLLDSRAPDGSPGYFLPFTDATTGDETYPAGRYVELQGPTGGPFVLDFNRAYNPSCAYGDPERFACPVTPPENKLDVRIEAGERGYRSEAERG